MNRPVHFEIHADDVERASKFYTAVFGWEITKWQDMEYWIVMTAPKDSKEMGINGGLLKRPQARPAPEVGVKGFVCTMLVENYDESEKKILAAGGVLAVPKTALLGMAWQGYYIDTEGNIFGIHQPDPNAK